MNKPSPQPGPAVEFRDVVKVCNGRVTALDHVSFEIPRGATVALLGANGAGKSTAIDTMLGLRKPASGERPRVARGRARRLDGGPRRDSCLALAPGERHRLIRP